MTRPIPLFTLLILARDPAVAARGARLARSRGRTPNAAVILAELRLPRALLAVSSAPGSARRGRRCRGTCATRSPIPGCSASRPGAALGAVASFWFGYAASAWLLPLFALAGAGGAMALLALIAGRTAGVALFTLAGMMIASLAGALMSLAISLAPNAFAMSEIVTWLMGALTDRGWAEVRLAAPLTLAGIVLLRLAGPGLDALTLGEPAARSLGVNPRAAAVAADPGHRADRRRAGWRWRGSSASSG